MDRHHDSRAADADFIDRFLERELDLYHLFLRGPAKLSFVTTPFFRTI